MVPPVSRRVSRVPRYSGFCCLPSDFAYGIFTLFDWLSQKPFGYLPAMTFAVRNPQWHYCHQVWPLSVSLATTPEITLVFFSCRYLDVSVHGVSPPYTMDSYMDDCVLHSRVSPFGHPRFLRLFAPTRGFSQLSASFFGSWRQGIHPLLFLA